MEDGKQAKHLYLIKTQAENFVPPAKRAEQNSRFLVYLCLAT